jgi:hypothetical protein
VVEHNTAVNNGTHGNFLWLLGAAKGLRVMDNLFVAPKLQMGVGSASGLYVCQNDLSSFSLIDGNVWPAGKPTDWAQGGANYVGTTVSSSGYRTQGEWNALPQVGSDVVKDVQLGSGSYSIGAGVDMVGAAAFPTLRLAA